ncbi:MAG: hypothetical protein AVDCRST_MAG68-4641 [uncultured Gemmatimonadetes bacterium]|uniref:Uncharacterized protein n=1 Tax=uncultured Gemmatimonadota bacterium TaxID=203437 RepID=A0A6J4MQ40_9BACT|nr:MAG: hypothetical protein AVDCRST_MAG68-4641 [uncultured Gemmatimonadota bacterium]
MDAIPSRRPALRTHGGPRRVPARPSDSSSCLNDSGGTPE